MADGNESEEIEKEKRSKQELQNISPMRELGSTGIAQFSGVIDEDFLDDISGREKLVTYKEMSKNDAIVSAILYAIDQLMKQVKWHVRPVSNDQADQEAAEFLRQCMEDMDHSWERMIGQINNRHTYGFAPMEQVYKQRTEENSQFADGRIGWKKIEIRRPDTMWEWIYDDDEATLIGMRQQNPSTFKYNDIPIEKLLNFTVQGEGGSPEGESLLRGAYRSWYYKKKLEEIEAIGIERDATGIPVVGLPPEFFAEDGDADQKSILRKMESLAQDIRNNENAGVTMPRSFDENGNQRFKLKLLESPGDGHTDITETLEQKRQEIATSLLSDFLLLGQSDQVGSFALSQDKTSMFSLAIESLLDGIQGKFNKKGIPKLFGLNDFDVDELPKIEHDDIRKEDIGDIGQLMKDLANANAMPFANDDQNELLNTILKEANLPTVEEQQGPSDLDQDELTSPQAMDPEDN